tara:strand:- start:38 stop:574 length:537 start_codon:yes stop_codon:yes gene_type:complete
MSEEKKLLEILEQFRNQLSDKEIAIVDDISKKGESIKKAWDTIDSDYSLFIDGAAEFDEDLKPNNAGIGGLIKKGDKLIYSFSKNIGIRTNNEAEYSALIEGIKACLDHKIYHINIFSDSELVVNQVNGKYKLKDPKMIKLHDEVKKICSKLTSWTITHVRREQNIEADELSKEGLTK